MHWGIQKRRVISSLSGLFLVVTGLMLWMGCSRENERISELRTVCFESEVQPILVSNCAQGGCHDAASAQSGYILTDYDHVLSKGIERGSAEESELYQAVLDEMPPEPRQLLSKQERTLLRVWIEQGARPECE